MGTGSSGGGSLISKCNREQTVECPAGSTFDGLYSCDVPASCPDGMSLNGAVCYSPCPDGMHPLALGGVCSAPTINGLTTITPHSVKSSCPNGMEDINRLCYKPCPSGMTRTGGLNTKDNLLLLD